MVRFTRADHWVAKGSAASAADFKHAVWEMVSDTGGAGVFAAEQRREA